MVLSTSGDVQREVKSFDNHLAEGVPYCTTDDKAYYSMS